MTRAISRHKKGEVTSVRCSVEAAEAIKRLARDIFLKYPEEHAGIGIDQPSSKVAIDALILIASDQLDETGIKKPEVGKNNMMRLILGKNRGVKNE